MHTSTHRILFLDLLLMAAVAFAQTPQASISGVVTDSQGAVIASAEVVATSAATSVKFAARTNSSGFYSIPFLPIGDYTVTVEHSGFRRSVRQGVALSTGQVLALDIQLELGAVSESINVSATAAMIETRTSDVSQLVDSRTVEEEVSIPRRIFNLFNHPSFGTPGQNLGGPGFGVVSTASPGRTIQLGARFAF